MDVAISRGVLLAVLHVSPRCSVRCSLCCSQQYVVLLTVVLAV
jgi:hypothetical protein